MESLKTTSEGREYFNRKLDESGGEDPNLFFSEEVRQKLVMLDEGFSPSSSQDLIKAAHPRGGLRPGELNKIHSSLQWLLDKGYIEVIEQEAPKVRRPKPRPHTK